MKSTTRVTFVRTPIVSQVGDELDSDFGGTSSSGNVLVSVTVRVLQLYRIRCDDQF